MANKYTTLSIKIETYEMLKDLSIKLDVPIVKVLEISVSKYASNRIAGKKSEFWRKWDEIVDKLNLPEKNMTLKDLKIEDAYLDDDLLG